MEKENPCSSPPFLLGGEVMTTVAMTPSHDALDHQLLSAPALVNLKASFSLL